MAVAETKFKIQYLQMSQAHNEAIRDRILLDRRQNDASFRICRRLKFTDRAKILEADRMGECAECSVPIVYDSRDSSPNTPKVCFPCAWKNVSSIGLDALNDRPATDQDLNDSEYAARISVAISQNKHREIPSVKKPLQSSLFLSQLQKTGAVK